MSEFSKADRIAELDELMRFVQERGTAFTDPSELAQKIGGHLIPIAVKAATYIQEETFDRPDWKGRSAMGVILANKIGQSIYTNEAEVPYYHDSETADVYLDRQFILPSSEDVATLRILAIEQPQANELPNDIQYQIGAYRAASLEVPSTAVPGYKDYDYSLPPVDSRDELSHPEPQELKGHHIASYWLVPHQGRMEYLLAYDKVGEDDVDPAILRKALTHAALVLVGGLRHALEIA